MRRLPALAALLLVGVAVPAARDDGAPVKALVGGTLIDGFGGRPIRDSVVLIDGERISAVGTVDSLAVPAGAEVISTEGMTVLPGLWDMHVHLMINGHADYGHWDRTYPPLFETVIMPASAHQLLLAGVTIARDLGVPLAESVGACASSTSARTSAMVIWSWSISLTTSTPASASRATLARASASPSMPQRNASVPG